MKINKTLIVSLLVGINMFLLPSCNKDTPTRAGASTVEEQVKKYLIGVRKVYPITGTNSFAYDIESVVKTDGRYDTDTKMYVANVTYRLKMNVSSRYIKDMLHSGFSEDPVTHRCEYNTLYEELKALIMVLNTPFVKYNEPEITFNKDDIVEIRKTFSLSLYESGWKLLFVSITH